jgi:hypothetical protein
LGGCGGGGGGSDGPSVLTPSLTYPTTVISPWEKSELLPIFSGLEGQAATCKWGSSPPPPGFTIENTCRITILDASPGTHSLVIDLNVNGYYGTKSIETIVNIDGPKMSYKYSSALNGSPDALVWMVPLSVEGGKAILTGYASQPGDLIAFKTQGSMAPGLSMDPITGQLSGTPQSTNFENSGVYAELTRAGKSIKLRVANPYIKAVLPWALYSDVAATTLETSKVTSPVKYNTLTSDNIRFGLHTSTIGTNSCMTNSPQLTASQVAVDPTTGNARPTGNTKGIYCLPLSMTVVRGGNSYSYNTAVKFEIR